jgi:putative DNA primase/helicase
VRCPRAPTGARTGDLRPLHEIEGIPMDHASTAETLNMPEQDWPEPQPISAMLPAVPALNPLLLPDALRPWIVDSAERMSVPAEMVAIPAIVALATIIAGKRQIQPKQHDDGWRVVPNLWGAIVARPGMKKSDAARQALRPLRHLDDLAWEQYQQDLAAYQEEKAEREQSERAAPGQEPREPTAKRYIINDTTPEALHKVLQENPDGVMLYRDELSGWLGGLKRSGREGERSFWLETWSGNGSYTADRILRGTLRAERLCLSMVGTIQPGPLSEYVREAVHGYHGADGLLQRFQLLVWPEAGEYRYVDRVPDRAAAQRYGRIFDQLDAIEPAEEPLRFEPEAQRAFDDWIQGLERPLHECCDGAALVAHLSKYRSLMPSLAAIFELAEWAAHDKGDPPRVISPVSTKRATAWCAYLEIHARRVYALGHTGDRSPAALLADKIEAGDLGSPFSRRDVQRKKWRGLKDETAIDEALAILCERHWLRAVERQKGQPGRPSEAYLVNPRSPVGR